MLLSPLTTTLLPLLLALFQVGLALSVSLIVLLLLCGGALAGLNTFEVGLPVHDHAVRIGPPDLSGGRLGARLHTRKRSRGRSLCKEAPCGPLRRGLKMSVPYLN